MPSASRTSCITPAARRADPAIICRVARSIAAVVSRAPGRNVTRGATSEASIPTSIPVRDSRNTAPETTNAQLSTTSAWYAAGSRTVATCRHAIAGPEHRGDQDVDQAAAEDHRQARGDGDVPEDAGRAAVQRGRGDGRLDPLGTLDGTDPSGLGVVGRRRARPAPGAGAAVASPPTTRPSASVVRPGTETSRAVGSAITSTSGAPLIAATRSSVRVTWTTGALESIIASPSSMRNRTVSHACRWAPPPGIATACASSRMPISVVVRGRLERRRRDHPRRPRSAVAPERHDQRGGRDDQDEQGGDRRRRAGSWRWRPRARASTAPRPRPSPSAQARATAAPASPSPSARASAGVVSVGATDVVGAGVGVVGASVGVGVGVGERLGGVGRHLGPGHAGVGHRSHRVPGHRGSGRPGPRRRSAPRRRVRASVARICGGRRQQRLDGVRARAHEPARERVELPVAERPDQLGDRLDGRPLGPARRASPSRWSSPSRRARAPGPARGSPGRGTARRAAW